VSGNASQDEQVGQNFDHIDRLELAGDTDRQAFMAELVEHVEHPVPASIVGAILDEVIGPDMIALLRPQRNARSVGQPEPAPAWAAYEEAVAEWFEEDDAVPFMMQVFQIREEKRKLIPAVTHVDGSGRLQTVSSFTNPRYHRLIESFRAITGVPMVLNTSFNENEPVVCKPQFFKDKNGHAGYGRCGHYKTDGA
jgi:hypothetical protein